MRNANANVNFQPWWTKNQPKVYSGKAEEGSYMQVELRLHRDQGRHHAWRQTPTTVNYRGATYYELFDRMGVYFAPSYDFVARKMLSSAYGVRFKSPCDCWSFDIGITKTYNPSETSFQFQLTLGGIGSVGQSPFGRNPFQRRTTLLPIDGARPAVSVIPPRPRFGASRVNLDRGTVSLNAAILAAEGR